MTEEQRNPRAVQPNTDGALHQNPVPELSLVESLGPTVDGLRQIFTDVGMRPYRVFSVVVRFSGGEPGRGREEVASETELLPTPKLDVRPVTTVILSGGRVERGGARLSEVSPRYTEDDIRALFRVKPLPAGHVGYIESRIDGRDGVTQRRRFAVKGAPFRDAENFQWIVQLGSEDGERSRDGTPRGPREHHDRRSI